MLIESTASSPLSSARSDITTPPLSPIRSSTRSAESLDEVDLIKAHYVDEAAKHNAAKPNHADLSEAEENSAKEKFVPGRKGEVPGAPAKQEGKDGTKDIQGEPDTIPESLPKDDAIPPPSEFSETLPDVVPDIPPDTPQTSQPLRPKRDRKSTVRYEGSSQDQDLDSPSKMAKITLSKPRRLPRAAKEPNYSASFVTTSEKSVLVNTDLDKLLSDDRAWTSLSREQQEKLLRLLPNAPPATAFPADEPLPNLPKQILRDSQAFRTDLRLFQEDLGSGRLDLQWRREAAAAMEERAQGKFDAWKYEEREQWWGQKMKDTNT